MKITIASIQLGEKGRGGGGGCGGGMKIRWIFLQNETPHCSQFQFHLSRIGK